MTAATEPGQEQAGEEQFDLVAARLAWDTLMRNLELHPDETMPGQPHHNYVHVKTKKGDNRVAGSRVSTTPGRARAHGRR